MAKALLIAEKPSLERDLVNAYKNNKNLFEDEIDFDHFVGHTMSLKGPGELNPEWEKWSLSNLPIIPDKFEYKVSDDKKKIFNGLKKKIEKGGYDYLINGCDSGREGQAIFHTFYRYIDCKLPVKRIWHNDTTEEELLRALTNLRDDLNEPALYNMTEASILRAEFDWLIGMNYSPAYTLRANTGKAIGVGRVMTPTLAIIVNRELEIRNFVPKDFYELDADFGIYSGKYFNEVEDKEVNRFDTMEDVNKIKNSLDKSEGSSKIILTKKEKSNKYAPKLHNLAEIQSEAGKTHKYSAKKTLEVVQSLYEKKLLSYPRTDSNHLTEAMVKDFPKMLGCLKSITGLGEHVDKVLGDKSRLASVGKNKKYVDDAKVSDHYAITPTGVVPNLGKLTDEEVNVYTLVAKRFLAIFLDPQVTENSTIITENAGHKFKTKGTILVDKGYTVLYGTTVSDKLLPVVNEGDSITLKKTSILSKKTNPPERYVDGPFSMVMANVARMVENEELKEVLKEAEGIGTPATRHTIIEKLLASKTVMKKKDTFYATDYGISIINGLRGQEIILPELTAIWESKLTQIEKCVYSPEDFKKEMIEYIKEKTEEMKNMTVNIEGAENQNKKPSIGKCPKCGKDIIEGKKGFGCSGYKEGCDFAVWKESNFYKDKKIGVKEMKALLKGSAIFGNLKLNKEHKLEYEKKDSAGKCPKCGKDIMENSKAFGCSGYKEGCKFTIWKESKFYKDKKIGAKEMKALLNGEAIFGNLRLNASHELEYDNKK